MYLHVDFELSDTIELINLDTNKPIRNCIWANDKTGEYAVYVYNDKQELVFKDGGGVKDFTTKGNIELRVKPGGKF